MQNKLKNIDPEIMELFFLNPSLPIDFILQAIDKINANPNYNKAKAKEALQGIMQSFIGSCKLDSGSKAIACEKAQKHIAEWREHIGKPQLKDILKMAKNTSLSVFDLIHKSDLTPTSITDVVDDYVIGQNDYIDKLSLAFYTHYLRVHNRSNAKDLPRANLLVYGPTGSGKTFAVQVLGELFNLNVGIVNCNSLVQEGIVGQTVTDVFTEIYLKNNKNLKAVENSIIFFDEFDKLLESGSYNKRSINEMLSIIDDKGNVQFNTKHGNEHFSSLRVSTANMLFVFSGVFDGLRDVVSKKLGKNRIGFSSSHTINLDSFYEFVEPEDFKKLNIKPEILGRIHDYAYVKELTADAIEDILLHSAQSPITPFRNYFAAHGIELEIEEEGAEELAIYAVDKKIGARGVKSLLWQILSQDMGDVGEMTDTAKIVINKNFVQKKLKKTT